MAEPELAHPIWCATKRLPYFCRLHMYNKVSSCVTLVDNGYDVRKKACHSLAASHCRDLIGTDWDWIHVETHTCRTLLPSQAWIRCGISCKPCHPHGSVAACRVQQCRIVPWGVSAILSMLHPAASGVMPEHQEAVEEEKPLWWTILQVRSCGLACRLFRGLWRRKFSNSRQAAPRRFVKIILLSLFGQGFLAQMSTLRKIIFTHGVTSIMHGLKAISE